MFTEWVRVRGEGGDIISNHCSPKSCHLRTQVQVHLTVVSHLRPTVFDQSFRANLHCPDSLGLLKSDEAILGQWSWGMEDRDQGRGTRTSTDMYW